MDGSNPTVGLAAHTGQSDVRITAKAASEAEADALIAPVEAEIRERLGDAVYGTGDLSLEDALVALCVEAGASVAACEAGSGETLARRLGTAARNTDVYAGGVSLPDDGSLAEQLAVDASVPVAKLAEVAASAIRAEKGAMLGVAVVIRPMRDGDAEGYSGTAFAVATANGARSRRYALGTERLNAPIWATTHALDMARRTILKGLA
jgi:nicotinamide-nucleotide amidase